MGSLGAACPFARTQATPSPSIVSDIVELYSTPSSSPSAETDIAIIGAGIVGLAAGLQLQRDGREVLVLDRNEPASGASYGNGGYLAEQSIFPPASPAVLRRIPKMLLDPLGPLVIKASYLPRLIPWGLRLILATRGRRLEGIVEALASLNRLAVSSYAPLLEAARSTDMIDRRGGLLICRYESTLNERAESIPQLKRHGIAVERLNSQEILELEPEITSAVAGGLFYPNNARCVNPGVMGQRFASAIQASGGDVRRERVVRIQPRQDERWRISTDKGEIGAQQIIVSAGFWSDELLRSLGYKVPLISERGYHLTLPNPGIALTRPVVMAEPFFGAIPMGDQVRLSGTAEFASADSPPNYRRADILLDLAKGYLPNIHGNGAVRWMGVRPSLPDALPAIGKASRHPNLFYSFGHQHVGLTQAAISARLIADLIAGREPPVNPAPFSLDRFSVRNG